MGWPWWGPSVVELLLEWGPMGATVCDIVDGGVLDGVVVLTHWVGRGCVVFVNDRGRMLL